MNAVAKIEHAQPTRSVLVSMSDRYGMEPAAFEATVRATVCKGNVSREEFAAFLLVAKEHRLNPLTKEIYAFPAKGGGIQPIVSIDGWSRIINEHPAFDGMEFVDEKEDGDLYAITCRMFRKDRSHPISATEYMSECKRATDVWKTWPRRMLRHKAMIQAARYAFGFSGIVDPDEYERITSMPAPERPGLRDRLSGPPADEGFNASQAADGPVDFVEHAEEIAEAEFSEAPADEPAADVNDAWDHMAWAQAMREAADSIDDDADLQAWWADIFATDEMRRLHAADEAEALALKAHVIRRKKALEGGAQ